MLPHGYTKYRQDAILSFTSTITPAELRDRVFGGYTKSCHTEYKYDSMPEHTLSIVLENDESVLKRLRPAAKQFKIWYSGGRLYEPDFIAESKDKIYMIEVKNRRDISDDSVKLKSKAAMKYCENVNQFTNKKWEYVLLLDSNITRSGTLDDIIHESSKVKYLT